MRIVFTGGGTGGHFYPLIAVAEALRDVVAKEKVVSAHYWFFSDAPVDQALLEENHIEFVQIPAGKLRVGGSFFGHISQMVGTAKGVLVAIRKLYKIYPDVVFAKGGYSSFPTLFAAKLLRIPVIIHESDSAPGRVNMWAAKFAVRIATAFPETAQFFIEHQKKQKNNIASVGLPMRTSILASGQMIPPAIGIQEHIPIVLVVGGSQGSETINIAVLQALPDLLNDFQIVHQTGEKNLENAQKEAAVFITSPNLKSRYLPFAYLSGSALKAIGSKSAVVVSRAGSMLFEIASWGVPSILIPITHSNGDHQRKNAFSLAHAGGADVIEEANLTPHILASEIRRITGDEEKVAHMKKSALAFARTDAAQVIADEIFKIAMGHE